MLPYCYVNDQLLPSARATLGVNDLALLRAYGIFDYFLVRQGCPMFLPDYLDRFYDSAECLHLDIGLAKQALSDRIHRLIEANGEREAGMRLVLTGGYAEDGYTPTTPNLLILAYPQPRPSIDKYEKGVKLLSYAFRREVPQAKTINYLMGIQLMPELRKQGALEPLYHQDGVVSESVRSNIFILNAEGRLVTPDAGILYGITRRRVLELARGEVAIEERNLSLAEVKSAREAFLTGSTKRIMPVVQIDESVLGSGRPGPFTQYMMERFEQHSQAYARQAISALP